MKPSTISLLARQLPLLLVLQTVSYVACQPAGASKLTDTAPIERAEGIKIAAIGDSFTEGWSPTAGKKFPYTDYLSNCLNYRTGGKPKVQIDNKGYGWASVIWAEHNLTDTTLSFIANSVKSGVKYDWMVIWTGGVNDFFNSRYKGTPEQVLTVVSKIYDAALAAGWGVLVMPQVGMRNMAKTSMAEQKREKFEELLKAYVKKQNNPKLQFLDLSNLGLNPWAMSQQDLGKYVDRGLHFTEAGYGRVGQLVCDFMVSWLQGDSLTNVSYAALGVNYTSQSKVSAAAVKRSAASSQLPIPVQLLAAVVALLAMLVWV